MRRTPLRLTLTPSVLIAYRLWTRQSTMRDSRKAFGLTREARIMAESGAIYAITVILIISTYTSNSASFNVFLDMASPVIGVAVSGTSSVAAFYLNL